MTKPVQSNSGSTVGGVTGKGFMPGKSGNPGGRPAMTAEAREAQKALAASTPARIKRLEKLAREAEKKGDLKTAAFIELALLKKTMPDATELVVSVPEGLTVRTMKIDPKKLTAEQLAALHAAVSGAKVE